MGGVRNRMWWAIFGSSLPQYSVFLYYSDANAVTVEILEPVL